MEQLAVSTLHALDSSGECSSLFVGGRLIEFCHACRVSEAYCSGQLLNELNTHCVSLHH